MRYLHTMMRVGDLDTALDFYLATPEAAKKLSGNATTVMSPMIELTYNWDETRDAGGRDLA